MSGFKRPTQVIDLPSKGFIYPKDNPLSSGKIEMKFGSPQEEEILANESFQKEGTTLERLIKSLIITPINYDDLIVGDKNAIFIAARVLMFGKNYDLNYLLPGESEVKPIVVDLTTLKDKVFDESLYVNGKNEFNFKLPNSKVDIGFKLLTHKDEKDIEQEVTALKKIYKDSDKEVSVSWYYKIVSVDGDRSTATIRDFVNNGLITLDSGPLEKYIYDISPGIEFKFDYTKENGEILEGLYLPLTTRFFRSPFLV